MVDFEELSTAALRKNLHRCCPSFSDPVLPTVANGVRLPPQHVVTDNLEDVFGSPSHSCHSMVRSRPATTCSSSLPSNCRPGSGRFSPEEMSCFKRVRTPSQSCRGKEEVYWQSQPGLLKKSLSEGANCWHTLPVLKGKFYSQVRLDSADAAPEMKSPKKMESGLAALPEEAMTAGVLDEIYPRTPQRGVPARRDSVWDVSPSKDESVRSPLQIPEKTRKTKRHRMARASDAHDMSPKAASSCSAPSASCAASSSSFGAALSSSGRCMTTMMNTQSLTSASSPHQPSGGEGPRGTRTLGPLVHFRQLLEEKYGSVRVGVEFWMSEFNNNHQITKKEFRRILQSRMGLDLGKDTREAFFNLLDLDGDGMTSLAEFQVAIDAAGPVVTLTDLRRRWLATGFKSMNSALHAMCENEKVASKGLNLREFGEAFSRVHVSDPCEHVTLFNLIVDPQERHGRVSLVEVASAIATVSPDLLLEDIRERLLTKYRLTVAPLRRAWTDLELGGGEVRWKDFVAQSSRRWGLSETEAAKVFRSIECKDGYLDRTSFLSALSLSDASIFMEELRRKIRQRHRSIEALFDAIEFKEQGVAKLTLVQVQEMFLKIDLTEEQSETLFKAIDVENTGTLSATELIAGIHLFAPTCAFEELRLRCLQREQDIYNVFAAVDMEPDSHLDLDAFIQLLRDLGLVTVSRLRAMFDMLDVQSQGFMTLNGLVALLQAGGPGSGVKLEDDALRIRAKQDIRGCTAPVHRLVGDVKAQAREGKKTPGERLASFEWPEFSRAAPDSRPGTGNVAPRSGKDVSSLFGGVAPRLRMEAQGYPRQQASDSGPRVKDNRMLTEKHISDPQTSWNAVWKDIETCPGLDKTEKGAMEDGIQGYYQEVCKSLTGDMPLLEYSPSRHSHYHSMKTHEDKLEPESVKRFYRAASEATTQTMQSLPPVV